MLKIGSLFSGCGGLELGLEAALAPHARTVWQVEKEPYARAVLAKHWPEATRFDDVKTVGAKELEPVSLLCGGFPCQDLSNAAESVRKQEGLAGARSGLWWEMHRIICEIRPPVVVVENVPALITKGLPAILGALSEAGYNAEWDCISAASQGAPHKRDRFFLIAYTDSPGLKEQWRPQPDEAKDSPVERCCWWTAEPSVGRVDHGVPRRVDRLRLLGNAVVPQVAFQVGRRVRDILSLD